MTEGMVEGSTLQSAVYFAASRSSVAAGLDSQLIHHADVLTLYTPVQQELPV